MPDRRHPHGAYREILAYRSHRMLSQAQLAEALGVTQAYISQLERGTRRVSRKLAAKLAALPTQHHLPATVFPEELAPLDRVDIDLAADLAALGYPGFAAEDDAAPKNPAAVIVSILKRRHVAPGVMAAIPWVLLRFPDLNTGWLVDQARLNNLQNRLGFLTQLACEIAKSHAAAGRFDEAHLVKLEGMRGELESSRLAKQDTLARELSPSERQFFEEHRTETARHWNLLTGLTKETLPHIGASTR
ncbi:MAG TPA: helix-turn-helix transcriptional regulator [Vicinamibacterales bacterium]|nr:helix-turn-helix transcriptional regulator [Vicinamibacterales bacterium]